MPHYGIVNDTLIIQTYSEKDMMNKVKKIIEIIKDSDFQIYKINHKKDCALIYVNSRIINPPFGADFFGIVKSVVNHCSLGRTML